MHSGLVQPVPGLHHRVIEGVADAAGRGRDVLQFQVTGQPNRGVLRAGIAVMDQRARFHRVTVTVALPQRHPQRGHHQISVFAGRGVPGHDPAGCPEDSCRS